MLSMILPIVMLMILFATWTRERLNIDFIYLRKLYSLYVVNFKTESLENGIVTPIVVI